MKPQLFFEEAIKEKILHKKQEIQHEKQEKIKLIFKCLRLKICFVYF